jgi:hypothetical protein
MKKNPLVWMLAGVLGLLALKYVVVGQGKWNTTMQPTRDFLNPA